MNSPPDREGRLRGETGTGLRVSLGMVVLTVLLAGVVLIAGRDSLEAGQGDEIGPLLLLGVLTLLGLLVGLVTLVGALVVYARGRPSGRTLVVVVGSLAALVVGCWIIVWTVG